MSTFRDLRRTALLRTLASLSERRQRLVAWHALTMSGATTVGFSRNGVAWTVPVGDPHVGFGLFVNDGYQEAQRQALLNWLDARGRAPTRDRYFVDVGAHIGTTCIPVARERGCRVLAIEPAPANYELLRHNVTANALADTVLLLNAAVTARPGAVALALMQDSGGCFVARPGTGGGSHAQHLTCVECEGLPLREALARAAIRASDVALVWADVQGSEVDVIETGAEIWAAGAPLWAEFEPGMLDLQGALDAFFGAAAAAFDRFIDARDLVRIGAACEPRPIADMLHILPRNADHFFQTDLLLLPRAF